ncbi:MAG: hypothetical protein A2017_16930 [Lentisphaerae bacterium GWF2_44_16]|nr:MAG: hypothetical protein A2017_16930 [Lentisphaerae bacterium GWF2_44_16]HAU66616.1 hypothetical protein [Candidatus Uhrbacteria bacterium]
MLDVNRRIKGIAEETIAREALKPKGRPLETKAGYERLARDLAKKETIVDPEREKQKEFDIAKRALIELMTPKISSEGQVYTDVKFYTDLNDLDSLIDGVIEQLDKRGLWTKDEMLKALKTDNDIRDKAQLLDQHRRDEMRRDSKRLFLQAYLAELEVSGFTNPEEVKQKLKERLSSIEESLFEEF